MPKKTMNSYLHQHGKHNTLPHARRSVASFGRGGGTTINRPSDLERVTTKPPGTVVPVEISVAATTQFETDDDLLTDEADEELLADQVPAPTAASAQTTTYVPPDLSMLTQPELGIDLDDISASPTVHATNRGHASTSPDSSVVIPNGTPTPFTSSPPVQNNVSTLSEVNQLGDKPITATTQHPTGRSLFTAENQVFEEPIPKDPLLQIPSPPRPTTIPQPVRPYHGRFTWRIQTRTSNSSVEALRAGIQEVWDVLLSTDPSLIIYPWIESRASDASLSLSTSADVPHTTPEILNYFHEAYPRNTGGIHYISVRMGHELTFPELRRQAAHFFDDPSNRTRVGFWYKPLQTDNSVQVGWLLGSTPFMSTARLAEEIYLRSGKTIQVGCRWQMIALKTSIANLPDDQRFRAIHIEVKKDQHSLATRFLGDLFSKSRVNDLVAGTPLRLIPLIRHVLDPSKQAKCAHARVRQGVFLHQLKNSRVFTIQSLDFRSSRMQHKSIRDLIMEIKCKDRPSRNLFLSCDSQPDGAVLLTFREKDQVEAYARSQHLLAFLRFTNPPEFYAPITNAFSASEQAPVNKEVITLDEANVDLFEDADEDDMFAWDPSIHRSFIVDISDLEKSAKTSSKTPSTGSRPRDDEDDDSLSTFRSKKAKTSGTIDSSHTTTAPRRPPSEKPPARPSPTLPPDDQSMQSSITLESVASRMSNLESTMNKLVEALLQNHSNNLASTQNSGSSGAGRPS